MISERVRMIDLVTDEVFREIGIDERVQKIDHVEVDPEIVNDEVGHVVADLEIREVAHAIEIDEVDQETELIEVDLVTVNVVDLAIDIVDLRSELIQNKTTLRIDVTVAYREENVVKDQHPRIDDQDPKVIQNSCQRSNQNCLIWQQIRTRRMAHHLKANLNRHQKDEALAATAVHQLQSEAQRMTLFNVNNRKMQAKCVNIAQSEGLKVNRTMIEHARGIHNDDVIIDRDLTRERGNLIINIKSICLLRDCQS